MIIKKMDFYMSAVVSGIVLGLAFVMLFGTMDVSVFIEKVRKMRQHQTAFFKERKQSDLIAAKQLEKEVDRALLDGISYPTATLESTSGEGEQIDLFELE